MPSPASPTHTKSHSHARSTTPPPNLLQSPTSLTNPIPTIASPTPLRRHRKHLHKYNHFRGALVNPGALHQPHHVLPTAPTVPTDFSLPPHLRDILPSDCAVKVWGKRELYEEAASDMWPRRGRRHHADVDKLDKRGKTSRYEARRLRGRERRGSLRRAVEGEGELDARNSSGSEAGWSEREGEEGGEAIFWNPAADAGERNDEVGVGGGGKGVEGIGMVERALDRRRTQLRRCNEDDGWLFLSDDESADADDEEDFVVVRRTGVA